MVRAFIFLTDSTAASAVAPVASPHGDVGAPGHQRQGDVLPPHGEQWRAALLVPQVDPRAGLEQDRDERRALDVVKRSLAVGILKVRIGAGAQQQPDAVEIAI